VWQILRQLNRSSQRTAGQALETNEDAIEHWKRKTWPEIKKAEKEGRTIVFIDESGLSQRPLGTAWSDPGAPVPLKSEGHLGCRRNDHLEFLLANL
jgi:hypothetical protein